LRPTPAPRHHSRCGAGRASPSPDTAQLALKDAFDPPPLTEDILFQLPVTKAWLRQLILAGKWAWFKPG
jgi:hypothetical protein